MGFKCGIIGLPNVGKSLLFNILINEQKARSDNFPFCTIQPNIATVPYVDKRLDALSQISKSKKKIYSTLDFVDIAGLVKGASIGEGKGNAFLSNIADVDLIFHVVRCFDNDDILHVNNSINPINDYDTVFLELKHYDLEKLEKRLYQEKKKRDSTHISFLEKIILAIKFDQPIDWKGQEILKNELRLLSIKPKIILANGDNENYLNQLKDYIKDKPIINFSFFEIGELNFAIDNDLEREQLIPIISKIIQTGFNYLNLISYFTTGVQETRSWSILNGTLAPQAAAKIHSDFEKHFISAKVYSYDTFINSHANNIKPNFRQEGKIYLVKDGDIIEFLVNC